MVFLYMASLLDCGTAFPKPNTFALSTSYPEYEDFRRSTRSFFGLTAMDHTTAAFAKDANTPTKYLLGNPLDGEVFRTMRITPQLGRPSHRYRGRALLRHARRADSRRPRVSRQRSR